MQRVDLKWAEVPAFVECINELTNELKETIKNKEIASKMSAQAVRIYNEKRLHWSLQFRTPEEAHNSYNEAQYVSYKRKTA